jgi:hypothetical protein
MDEADTGVELRIPGQALLDAGHADQHHADAARVEDGPQMFERAAGRGHGLIFDGFFYVVDDEGVHRAFGWLELETKLLFECGEDGRDLIGFAVIGLA